MSAVAAEKHNLVDYARSTLTAAKRGDIRTLLSPARAVRFVFDAFYILVELIIIWLFKPVSERFSASFVPIQLSLCPASSSRALQASRTHRSHRRWADRRLERSPRNRTRL